MTQDAPFTLEFASHPAGLRVQARGDGSYASTLASWRAIAAELRARRPAGLLLVDELRGEPLSAAQWQSLVAAMAGEGLEAVRIAHVRPNGLQQVEHCEIYAREAGLDARVFAHESQADLWLRHGER